ncbi:MAG TPA: hypothetical protein ENG87_03940 [Candidatus Pacearchaeota archaeon]|nr:hypothetical protein [Candidatus Pacearchaeota archaeon]HDZ61183.1 hypothetical protein [Candidatus Pacearchaeota archaeon]
MKEPKTIFSSVDDGDSPLYVGIKYLGIVAEQIKLIKDAQRNALIMKGDTLFLWLYELWTFNDLVSNKTDLAFSKNEIDFFEFKMVKEKMVKCPIKIKEKDKYETWFKEIEKMIERNSIIADVGGNNPFMQLRYLNDKKIIVELSKTTRELFRDANSKHLIMPEGQQNMKELVKKEWIDREPTKIFTSPEEESDEEVPKDF